MKKVFVLIFILIFAILLLAACGRTPQQPRQITAEELHQELFGDKRHNKALIINSRYCGHCEKLFRSRFLEAIDSCSDRYRFFVVLMDSMSLDSARAYYDRVGYHGMFYVVTDGQPGDSYALLKALFPDEDDELLLLSGLPFSGVLDRKNRLYKERIYHPIFHDTILHPYPVSHENLDYLLSW